MGAAIRADSAEGELLNLRSVVSGVRATSSNHYVSEIYL